MNRRIKGQPSGPTAELVREHRQVSLSAIGLSTELYHGLLSTPYVRLRPELVEDPQASPAIVLDGADSEWDDQSDSSDPDPDSDYGDLDCAPELTPSVLLEHIRTILRPLDNPVTLHTSEFDRGLVERMITPAYLKRG
ncbi:hypothetical protein HK405_008136 [Cladochytrium tenue]|nr:hypothetical protein HK405_008136 [Cladochytrium tenue]